MSYDDDKRGDFLFAMALFSFVILSILIKGAVSTGDSAETDKQVLLSLKEFLQKQNKVNQGSYSQWNSSNTSNPCQWRGIVCDETSNRVTGVSLSESSITGMIFPNFSALTALTHLDLSKNTLTGPIPGDLSRCRNLRHLNLSHNIIVDELRLSELDRLETLDISVNRIVGDIESKFPSICSSLVVANLSQNNFTGAISRSFDSCLRLKYLDLSSNNFSGELWTGFSRLVEFSVSENNLVGGLGGPNGSVFTRNCSLQVLDLSENHLSGEVPGEISNCKSLTILHLWRNNFTGKIPAEIGSISGLEALFLGDNRFSRDIPESLLSLESLDFLDLSKNRFGREIQPIFGKFNQVKFLVLHGNSYTGGIESSGILRLPKVLRLDLSFNNFSGPLPVEISEMRSLEILSLAYNKFNGSIPLEFGNLSSLQALDLSFNGLTGPIPPTLGKLSSLLWLMLANNSLSGPIPREIGGCVSLLWLNLANNRLSGAVPAEMTNIGTNPTPTFESNKKRAQRVIAGSGECLAMRRWIPADYPPFSFVYTILTRKSCRSIWDRLLRGLGLFPICLSGSTMRNLQISGYVQLSGNELDGELPREISNMKNFSMLHLGCNNFSGKLPPGIWDLPLVVLNVSGNGFSGEIAPQIGRIKCLQSLDLSRNNFGGAFPWSLTNLTELNKFNISYNPLISGPVPSTGQMATFERDSFLGDPNLVLPEFIVSRGKQKQPPKKAKRTTVKQKPSGFGVFLAASLALVMCTGLSLALITAMRGPQGAKVKAKGSEDAMEFTEAEILRATGNFSERRVVGRGGFGTVYRGFLRDGREVAVKRLRREGTEEGEREFRAEMEALRGQHHPNLVTLHGWCRRGPARALVYDYMPGGTLEDRLADPAWLGGRLEAAADVARALVFLHHECDPPVVHRDVKAGNVLFDSGGTARVTDFGLARLVGSGDSHVSTVVAGTVGYVAPEYAHTWRASTRGDVYSFGVVAMEIASGRRAVDSAGECLVEQVRDGDVDGAGEMAELLRVGVKCTAENPQLRPNMKEVLAMIVNIIVSKTQLPNI